jgi:hypothetical protein
MCNGLGIEPKQVPALEVRDPPLGHEAADMADAHPQVLGNRLDVEQVRQRLPLRASHDASLLAPPSEAPS